MSDSSYELDHPFESLVVWLCSTNTRFYRQIGYAIEASCLRNPIARMIMEIVHKINVETGRSPSSTVLVMQRVARRVRSGKVAADMITQISDLYDSVEDDVIPNTQQVVNELIPVVRRHMQSQMVLQVHKEFSSHGDFDTVRSMLDSQAKLGVSERAAGVRLGPAGFDMIGQAQTFDRLPTGVLELDLKIDGGVPCKTLSVWVGDSGSGKSMALVHQACECLRQMRFVGLVTLELPEAVQLARIFANLTGIATNDIINVSRWRDESRRRYGLVESSIGLCEVAEFTPYATSVSDLVDWVDQQEQRHGKRMEILVVDYADKMYEPKIRNGDEYLAMRYVYEGLRRDIANDRNMWVITGSQATRPKKDSGKTLDTRHVADSMHKVRCGDCVYTLNPDDDGLLDIFVAKNRLGASRFSTGPLLTDFERARLVNIPSELGSW